MLPSTQYTLHHVAYTPAKTEGTMSKGLGGDAFTRKYVIRPLTLTFLAMLQKLLPSILYIMRPMHLVIGNVTQYPL